MKFDNLIFILFCLFFIYHSKLAKVVCYSNRNKEFITSICFWNWADDEVEQVW